MFFVTANFNLGTSGQELRLNLPLSGLSLTNELGNTVAIASAVNGTRFALSPAGTLTLSNNTDSNVINPQGAKMISNGTSDETNKVFAFNLASQTDTITVREVYMYNSGSRTLEDLAGQMTLTIGGQSVNGTVSSLTASGVRFTLPGNGVVIPNTGVPTALVVRVNVPSTTNPTNAGFLQNGLQLVLGTGNGIFANVDFQNNGFTSTDPINNGIRARSVNNTIVAVTATPTLSSLHTIAAVTPLFTPAVSSSSTDHSFNIFPQGNGSVRLRLNSVVVRCNQLNATAFSGQLFDGANNVSSLTSITANTNTTISLTGAATDVQASSKSLSLRISATSSSASSAGGSRTCTIVDANMNPIYADNSTGAAFSGSSFVNVIVPGGFDIIK